MTIITVSKTESGVFLNAGDVTCLAAIGRNGMTPEGDKTEGDGMTPIGVWPIRCLYYRTDRINLPNCGVTAIPITDAMGWCDDPDHEAYNTIIHLPFSASHEVMMRADSAYDIVITLGYNDDPPEAGRGSAIFFHLLHEDKSFTEGCVAIPRDEMLSILPMIKNDSVMVIQR